MGTIIIILAGIALVAWVVWYASSGKMSSGGGSGSSFLTGFHDFQPRDKQEAIEIVMEQNEGKRWEEQESGEGDKEGEGGPGKVEGEKEREKGNESK